MEISKINEIYRLDLPESDEYLTMAGYVLYNRQMIPQQGEIIDNGKFSLEIAELDNSRISRVILHLKQPLSPATPHTEENEKQ